MMEAGKREAQRTWDASPTGSIPARDHPPGTREFFDRARSFRDREEQPWLSEVVPFAESAGRRVLEIGCGPGYDALTFLRRGAVYTGFDLAFQNLRRTRRHLGYFSLSPSVLQADAEALPFADESFETAYSNGVLHHLPDIDKGLAETYRILRHPGDFHLLVYNRDSVFFVLSVLVPHLLLGRFLRQSLADRLSQIEFTTAAAKPIVNVFSKGQLRRRLEKAGFEVKSVAKRKCTWTDLPGSSKLGGLYRLVPGSIYRALGRLAGWYLIAHSVKAR